MSILLSETRRLCAEYGVDPVRRRGQNFLIDEEAYGAMVETADLGKDDTVVEVGPGLGFLTERLARQAGRVLAVEIDRKLAEISGRRMAEAGLGNVEIIQNDIISLINDRRTGFYLEFIGPGAKAEYKVAANLPYNITSFFLRGILSAPNKPAVLALMLQKEVAQRITAGPGEMSLLAVSVQFYADPMFIMDVPKEAFWPKPEVDSAILRIDTKETNVYGRKERRDVAQLCSGRRDVAMLRLYNGVNEASFFRLVKIGFSARRKMLKNNLANGFKISEKDAEGRLITAGLDPKARAQDLGVGDWLKLLGCFT